MKSSKLIFVLAAAALLASCGGGNTSSTPAGDQSKAGGTSQTSTPAEGKIELSIDKATIKVGETAKITSSVEGVTFEARDNTIVSVAADGTVTGLKAGSTKVTARKSGYKAANVDITVEKAAARAADFYLEFEDAEHFDPDGFWGMTWGGTVMGPGDTPIEETELAHGGKSIGWFNQGCKETIFFTADKAGKVEMDFMMAYNREMALEGTVTIKVNGVALDLTGKTVAGPEDCESDYDFNPVNFKDVSVKAGENTIEVECVGQNGPNMDCVQVYTKEIKIEQINKQPAAPVSMGTVDYLVEGYEWGPAITGVIVHFAGEVSLADLENLAVKTNGQDRPVIGVTFCDNEGTPSNAIKGNTARLDLQVLYTTQTMGTWSWGDDHGASPFTYQNVNVWKTNLTVEVSIASGKSIKVGDNTYDGENPAVAKEIGKRIVLSTKDWGEAKTHTADGKTLSYKAYSTNELVNDGVRNPLIIWLHGAGEGGTDPDIALLGNDVTNLGESKVQSHFIKDSQKGAYVLAVQTPTMWMDTGSGQHSGDQHSMYTKALKSTIDKYIEDNGDIDAGRIFVGGCSNGGFMTMEMAVTYPSFFRAYYPTCEAYQNAIVTDDDINSLKNLSMWFTHAANDPTVDPNNFTVPTYKRLMAAGAQDVHFSFFENVRGNEGNPEGMNDYNGHYSWIYVLKDECLKDQADYNNVAAPSTVDVLVDGQPVSLWGWMASK